VLVDQDLSAIQNRIPISKASDAFQIFTGRRIKNHPPYIGRSRRDTDDIVEAIDG